LHSSPFYVVCGRRLSRVVAVPKIEIGARNFDERGDRKSEIWNQEIWDLEIARFLHLKAEIIKF